MLCGWGKWGGLMGGRGGWEGGLVGGSGGDYTATLTYTDDPHPPYFWKEFSGIFLAVRANQLQMATFNNDYAWLDGVHVIVIM